jgi:CRISPR-associated endonuclease Cas1
MAATPTVSQRLQFRKSAKNAEPPQQSLTEPPTLRASRHGVVTLFGYGIKISVERGHLTLEDGIGADRHRWRFSRVGHGLRRLVVIGADGFVSLAALRWLADQDAAFVMLNRDGSVLATTGPVRPSDARLRRAQALALHSGAALRIVRELISQKLAGQEQVAKDKLCDSAIAGTIAELRAEVATAESIQTIRQLEARAGLAYWSAWHNLPVSFPKADLRRVPDHWRIFGTRRSPLSGSPRLAVNPPNAILNYCYSVLQAEVRLAAAAVGLDPGLGVLHTDTPARDSLACDLMEPVRPAVDAFVLDWIIRGPLRREWFFEQRDGNCRLMGSFTAQLSETAPMWRRAVAPLAESVARTLWSMARKPEAEALPATRLTQRRRREAQGGPSLPPAEPAPRQQNVCRVCGARTTGRHTHCANCAVAFSTVRLRKAALSGRVAAQSSAAQIRRANTQRRQHAAKHAWKASNLPAWLDEQTYVQKIQPQLVHVTRAAIASAIEVSKAYAADIRVGKRSPHPRHWQALAQLVGFSSDAQTVQ